MMEGFKVPRDPHPNEPDELTPDTLPIDDIERPHREAAGPDAPPEPSAKDLEEAGVADRTPRP